MQPSSSHDKIRQLNDTLRTSLAGGRILITPGVQSLGPTRLARLLKGLAAYNDFSVDNDPYGEHDFGAINDAGDRFFWKIDYYDIAMLAGSSDPANPAVTTRVLTLMRADEY